LGPSIFQVFWSWRYLVGFAAVLGDLPYSWIGSRLAVVLGYRRCIPCLRADLVFLFLANRVLSSLEEPVALAVSQADMAFPDTGQPATCLAIRPGTARELPFISNLANRRTMLGGPGTTIWFLASAPVGDLFVSPLGGN